jgi:heme o synthase
VTTGRPARRSARLLLDLTKFPISLLVTLTTAAGFLACARRLDGRAAVASGAVLLLAMGACALNQWQEREADARMERTRRRPLPSGAVRPRTAFLLGAGLVAAGALVLALHGPWPAALGLLAVAWYNGVYTPLKRVTPFAAVPGAAIGALPPAIGWAAAGGSPADPRALTLAFFFFVWQIPHFWVLLLRYGDDYRAAGFPSLTEVFSRAQLARLTFVWTLFTAGAGLLLHVSGPVESPWAGLGLLATGLALAIVAAATLRTAADRALRLAFRAINSYALAVLAVIALDAAM